MTNPATDTLRAAQGGPHWLTRRRQAAQERFAELGFPTRKNENWHYTSVAPIVEAGYTPLASPSGNVAPAALVPYLFDQPDWPLIVFLNGRYSRELSTPAEQLPEGVRVAPLGTLLSDGNEAPEDVRELVEQHLCAIADIEEHAFTALNAALTADGVAVVIGSEMVVDTPIHLLFVTDPAADRRAIHPRNLIVAGRHSKASLLESYIGLGNASYFMNSVTEVVVDAGATLNHIKVQRESERAFHIGTVDASQGRDSHYLHFSFAVGAALSRTNVHTLLGGEGCGATLDGLYMLDGEQHCDHQTRIEHKEPNCFSREVYKGLLAGHSHGVFNGKVYVHPEAQKTDGKQENNVILLSETAQIDSKPELEIYADDVKCTHGATVGQLDETALFYMKSRGVDATTARQLLTYAFAADVIEAIEIDAVRDGLEALTMERFTGVGVGAR